MDSSEAGVRRVVHGLDNRAAVFPLLAQKKSRLQAKCRHQSVLSSENFTKSVLSSETYIGF